MVHNSEIYIDLYFLIFSHKFGEQFSVPILNTENMNIPKFFSILNIKEYEVATRLFEITVDCILVERINQI